MRVQAAEIMARVVRDEDAPFLPPDSFADHVIEGDLELRRVECRDVDFQGAVFEGSVDFTQATFTEDADFHGATFRRGVSFVATTFEKAALFQRMRVSGGASFRSAVFNGVAFFGNVVFEGQTDFSEAVFVDDSGFSESTFLADVVFERTDAKRNRLDLARCVFREGLVSFRNAKAGEVCFSQARFGSEADLDLHADLVTLSQATCSTSLDLEATAGELRCDGLKAPWGASIHCRSPEGARATVVLDGVRFGASTHVSGAGDLAPELISMRDADAANLTLSNLTFSSSRFHGAHNLDQLRLASASFVQSPPGWRVQLPWLWVQRWTSRRVLAEEAAWRVHQRVTCPTDQRMVLRWPDRFPMRWPEWCYVGDGPERPRWQDWGVPEPEPPALDPRDIETLYRALRKGREDHKDEPGAADFYYGEMEMRRWGARERSDSLLDRFVLGTYWLISGYALRASRAATTLALVIVVFAGLFLAVGFAEPAFVPRATGVKNETIQYENDTLENHGAIDDAFRALSYSAATATAIAAAPERRLKPVGEALRIVLRIVGPLLLALTAISIRGRIKR